MREFDVWGIAMLLHHINDNRNFCQRMCDAGGADDRIDDGTIRATFRSTVDMALILAKETYLQSTRDRVWENGPLRMSMVVGITWREMGHELKVLKETIEADLEKHTFVFVLPEKASVMRGMSRTDWAEIWQKFPSAFEDIKHASECHALEQNTACVFHMMRVAEHGLRGIARKVKVKLTDKGKRQPIEFATWDKVIQGINNHIATARAFPHGPRKNKNLQFYSSAAENCTYIRDIWRNEVSHTRSKYNDGEVLGIINRVKDFMWLLASGPK
jgi:hypothetical protein